MHQLLPQYIIWTVCSTLFTVTYGCGRTPATPRPTTAAPVTTTSFVSNRKPCTENETLSQGCLNGGTCFVMEFEEGHRTTHCYCKENYIGKTCFYIDPTLIFQREREDHVKAAAIAASVVGIVLFVTVIVCILVLRKRYIRRKAQENEKVSQSRGTNAATNGISQATDPLIGNGGTNRSETRV